MPGGIVAMLGGIPGRDEGGRYGWRLNGCPVNE